MRKFRFNLQRLLDYRESVEDKLLAELAAIRAQYDRESQALVEIIETRDSFRDKMRGKLSRGCPEEIRQAYRYLNELTAQVKAQEIRVSQAAELREAKTAEVVEAAKERKVLERLREYKVVEHRKEADAHEQKFLDDIACIRHNRASQVSQSTVGGGR